MLEITIFADPGNDCLASPASIDIAKLITVNDVMENCDLGPNGALVYSMEFLEKNLDWLFVEIAKFPDHYFFFDFPGQVNHIIVIWSYYCNLVSWLIVLTSDWIVHSS